MGAEAWVVEVLREGYVLPFLTHPRLTAVPMELESYSPTSVKGRALEEEIAKMISKGAIELAPKDPGFYSRIFVVTKATGGFRPVIDLSILNKSIITTKFRMETNKTVMEAIQEGDWMTSIDLKDAYFQIPIHQQSRRYLRFAWRGVSYQFRALCFGLSTAPQVFTRVMALVSGVAHKRGIRILRYLDDWLIMASSPQACLQSKDFILGICVQLGIVVNMEKSDLVPKQVTTYLGMIIDAIKMKAFPTTKRIEELWRVIRDFLEDRDPPVQLWLILLGHMSSLTHLIPNGRRRMRSLQWVLKNRWNRQEENRDKRIRWTKEVEEDIVWWLEEENVMTGQPLSIPPPSLILQSDASMEGWGVNFGDLSFSGRWSQQGKGLHINLLELRAIRLGLQEVEEEIVGRSIGIMADNSTALAYLQKQGGTISSSLNKEAQETLKWLEEREIQVTTQFVRGEENVVADCLSRKGQVISTEWTLNMEVCKKM